MVNFIWFTDDILLNFHCCSHKILITKTITFGSLRDSFTFTGTNRKIAMACRACEIVKFWLLRPLDFMTHKLLWTATVHTVHFSSVNLNQMKFIVGTE